MEYGIGLTGLLCLRAASGGMPPGRVMAGELFDVIAEERVERRLAAVLMADVAGYSRLMGLDESATLTALKRLRLSVVTPQVAVHRGRIVKVMGDGVIVVFSSVVDAVNCAVAIQRALSALNAATAADTPADRRIALRIGVNLCEVIVEGGDVYGDGVNVAARLQAFCAAGGVALSATAHEHAVGKVAVAFADAGEHSFKNIANPVRVFRWPVEGDDAAPRRARLRPPPPLPDKPSVAVLPFDNMSGDPEQEYLAEGVVESLTAALSRIRSFFVVARNSASCYKGEARNVIEIGRELGVAYLLEGSVQRAGGRVRITVQLIETAGGAHLWAEKYDGAIDEIFEMQDRLCEAVAGAMQPSIRLAEIARVMRKPPQDFGAYDYAMQAMRHVWTLEKDRVTRALELLENALALDPDYPLALALAGWCWGQRAVYGWVDDIAAARAHALRLAARAANLSSEDPLILAVLGAVQTLARNYGAARVLLERAIAIDPNAAWACNRLGWLEVYGDRPDSADPYFERSMRLSPLDPLNFNNYVGMASARQIAGDYSAAADLFQRALGERPSALWIYRNLAPALLAAGRRDEAEAAGAVLRAAYPDLTIRRFKDAMLFTPATLENIAAHLRSLGVPEV